MGDLGFWDSVVRSKEGSSDATSKLARPRLLESAGLEGASISHLS